MAGRSRGASDPRVRAEVQRLYERDGEVRASTVVDYATDPATALHGCFEWDDSKAAHQHRLLCARNILRVITIVYEEERQELVHVPAVFIDEEDGEDEGGGEPTGGRQEGAYKPIRAVVRVQGEFDRTLAEIEGKIGALTDLLGRLLDCAGTKRKTIKRDVERSVGDLERVGKRLARARSHN